MVLYQVYTITWALKDLAPHQDTQFPPTLPGPPLLPYFWTYVLKMLTICLSLQTSNLTWFTLNYWLLSWYNFYIYLMGYLNCLPFYTSHPLGVTNISDPTIQLHQLFGGFFSGERPWTIWSSCYWLWANKYSIQNLQG